VYKVLYFRNEDIIGASLWLEL